MSAFDITPFAVPNCPGNEVRFEDPRDVARIVVTFEGSAPRGAAVSYLRKVWPETRIELQGDKPMQRPFWFGWFAIDDWFNAQWQKAAAVCTPNGNELAVTFDDLRKELPNLQGCEDYHVTFRRTLGVRIDAGDAASKIKSIQVFTTSAPAVSHLRVELDAGKQTPGKSIRLEGHNAVVLGLRSGTGVTVVEAAAPSLALQPVQNRQFHLDVSHMRPASRYCNDDGLVTFVLESDTFTISLEALAAQGPIWYADKGVYIANVDDATSFAEYKVRNAVCKTVTQQVLAEREQTLGTAYRGQPRAHQTGGCFGCKHARQAFGQEPNGDLIMVKKTVTSVPGKDTPLFKNEGNGRLLLGLGAWNCVARYPDPVPVQALNAQYRKGDIVCEQTSFAVPLRRSILAGDLSGDEPIVAMLRLRFRNAGEAAATASMAVQYSDNSGRSENRLAHRNANSHTNDSFDTPGGPRDRLSLADGMIRGDWKGQSVLRAAYETSMQAGVNGPTVTFSQILKAGESCEVLLKVPYVAVEATEDLAALGGLEFGRCYQEMARFWRQETATGAQLKTPEEWLNNLYASHLAQVDFSDFSMPGEPRLINTSVGTSRYANYPNESCMILQELEERGLHDETQRRLEVWLKHQGEKGLLGNFTDHDGVFFAAGGYETCPSYNQAHGWVLWALAEHYFHTQDKSWYQKVAPAAIKGADWVFRQRRQTQSPISTLNGKQIVMPTRGWERGFLPAGGLEDVTDYFYWLSTNALTWRGVDSTARALEVIGHGDAPRVRQEADAMASDLRRGFEISRQYCPVVRLRDGRWVGHYPPRLYRRGRDVGWCRETLEGAVYLVLSGLYDANSPQGQWILDDFQDNLYMDPPFGYPLVDVGVEWFDRGGFSCQPNLLAGLLPYLHTDQPQVYDWMFFNAFASCYRPEVNTMIEHPSPCLGFSNSVPGKTSDQSNAVKWMRYMFVWAQGDELYLGRAIPRYWLKDGEIYATGVSTHFGQVSVTLRSQAAKGIIELSADLSLQRTPSKIVARIRHPGALPIKSVSVNGKAHDAFDAKTGDIDITGLTGNVHIEARY